MMGKKRKPEIRAYISPELDKRLNKYCKSTGLDRNTVVKAAVSTYIKNHDHK